ncbi:MAG: HD domain-containing protein [Clostridia bacterium]|nr:HD domain-containing protein [Clostridia bacterium]
MRPEALLEILRVAARLKTNTRHCFTAPERAESVADHSWRTALMAMLLSGEEEYRDLDMDRIIRMCLIHDLGEAFTGDIPTFLKTDSDTAREDDIFDRWVDGFAEPDRSEWKALLAEMKAQETPEARLYRSLDKLEAIIAHNESDIETWLPLEYDLQYTYGQEQIAWSPTLVSLRERIDRWTDEKIARKERADAPE